MGCCALLVVLVVSVVGSWLADGVVAFCGSVACGGGVWLLFL